MNLVFNSIVIFGVDRERGKSPAAVLVELSEELQALQTQVMHVAAQQVQAEVQRMADQENDQEHDAG